MFDWISKHIIILIAIIEWLFLWKISRASKYLLFTVDSRLSKPSTSNKGNIQTTKLNVKTFQLTIQSNTGIYLTQRVFSDASVSWRINKQWLQFNFLKYDKMNEEMNEWKFRNKYRYEILCTKETGMWTYSRCHLFGIFELWASFVSHTVTTMFPAHCIWVMRQSFHLLIEALCRRRTER